MDLSSVRPSDLDPIRLEFKRSINLGHYSRPQVAARERVTIMLFASWESRCNAKGSERFCVKVMNGKNLFLCSVIIELFKLLKGHRNG